MGILRSKCKTIQLMYKQESSRFCYLCTFIRLIDRVGIVFPSFENIKIYMYKDVTIAGEGMQNFGRICCS